MTGSARNCRALCQRDRAVRNRQIGIVADLRLRDGASGIEATPTCGAHAAVPSQGRARVDEIQMPILFLTAGSDRLVDAGAAEVVFARIGGADRRLLAYDGFFHEVLNETVRERVLEDLRRCLDVRAPG
jgi:alpha-beta hydrolase superfamily lysophospholipase